MSGLFTGVCTTILTIGLLAPSARADDLSLMPKPSDENVAGLLRLECGHAPFPDCTKLVQELVDGKPGSASVIGIRKVADEIVEGLYEGKLYPNGRTKTAEGGQIEGRVSEDIGKPPICPPYPVVLNACKNEMKKNHLDQDCGKPFFIQATIGNQYSSNIRHTRGSQETANIAGSLIVAVSDAYKKIESEVKENRLQVESTSACAAQVEDLRVLIKRHKQMSNISKIESCDPKRLDECSARKYFDTGFESIRSAYLMIARCWIISESTKKYREFSSTALKRIENETMVPCANQCAGSNSCLSSCYVNKYEKWIKDELKAKFPQAASGC